VYLAEMKNVTMLATTANHLVSRPPGRRNVSHVDIPRQTALDARKMGRCVMKTLERPALPTPASDRTAGMTQHGRVRNPAAAAKRALWKIGMVSRASSRAFAWRLLRNLRVKRCGHCSLSSTGDQLTDSITVRLVLLLPMCDVCREFRAKA